MYGISFQTFPHSFVCVTVFTGLGNIRRVGLQAGPCLASSCSSGGGDLAETSGTPPSLTTDTLPGSMVVLPSLLGTTIWKIHKLIRAKYLMESMPGPPAATVETVGTNLASNRLTNAHKDLSWMATQGGHSCMPSTCARQGIYIH